MLNHVIHQWNGWINVLLFNHIVFGSFISHWWDQIRIPQDDVECLEWKYFHSDTTEVLLFASLCLLLLKSPTEALLLLVFHGAELVVIVAVAILVVLFSVQHHGTDRFGHLFAPIVFLWFLIIGGIGIFNIWKYDSSVLKAFSPLYVCRFFRKGNGWTSLGGIVLCITGKLNIVLNLNKATYHRSYMTLHS